MNSRHGLTALSGTHCCFVPGYDIDSGQCVSRFLYPRLSWSLDPLLVPVFPRLKDYSEPIYNVIFTTLSRTEHNTYTGMVIQRFT